MKWRRKTNCNVVVKVTFQHKACFVSPTFVTAKIIEYVISRDWDSRPPTRFNDGFVIWGVVSIIDVCVGVVSMVASSTIHLHNDIMLTFIYLPKRC
jgi:hypothetical protein